MRAIYFRCSTDKQVFLQQKEVVYSYLSRIGVPESEIECSVEEKVSGAVKHTDRQLKDLLDACDKGDVIYVSELSRLGRSMTDIFDIVTEASEKGITIIQCKDGTSIENASIGGKALLFALSLAAEIELANIRQRTSAGLAVRKEQVKKGETWISRSGRKCSRLGNEKGTDMTPAISAAAKRKAQVASKWRENSIGYKWVKRQLSKDVPRQDIIDEFNEYFEMHINGFSTQKGGPLTKSTLSLWAKEMGFRQ